MDHGGHLKTLQSLSLYDLAFHRDGARHFVHESQGIKICHSELNLKKILANMILVRIPGIAGLDYQLCTSEH